MNEKKKTILSIVAAVLLVIGLVIIFFVACNGNEDRKDGEIITQAVTNANGEVVTNPQGEVITEIVEVTQGDEKTTKANDSSSTTKGDNNKPANGQQNNNNNTTESNKNDYSGLEKPGAVKNLSVAMETTSAKLTWKANGTCSGYIVQYSRQGQENWATYTVTTDTQITIGGLETQTAYTFKVIAYNGSLNSGYVQADAVTVDGTTKVDDTSKVVTINVILPDSGSTDTLEIYVNDQLVDSRELLMDGSTVSFTTTEKYEGNVKVSAKLNTLGYDEFVNTDTGVGEINFSDNYIDYVEGGLD